jgi:hypothetical protein
MYISKPEFKALEKMYYLFPTGEPFRNLPKETQDTIVNGGVALTKIYRRMEKENVRKVK